MAQNVGKTKRRISKGKGSGFAVRSIPEVKDAMATEAMRLAALGLKGDTPLQRAADASYAWNWLACWYYGLTAGTRNRIMHKGKKVLAGRLESSKPIPFDLTPAGESVPDGATHGRSGHRAGFSAVDVEPGRGVKGPDAPVKKAKAPGRVK